LTVEGVCIGALCFDVAVAVDVAVDVDVVIANRVRVWIQQQ
jgi:hypothetical protein